MAFPRDPDADYRTPNELPPRMDNELQPAPELAEGPSSPGRVAAYAIAAILIVGAVLYGVSHTASNSSSNPPSSTAANTPAAPANPSPAGPGTPNRRSRRWHS